MFSSRGQEFAIDTFGATKKKRGLSEEDMHQVGMAMKEIVEMTRMAIDMKDDDGTPLFKSVDELEREIFTPLVREGILPENFVLDQYSEVQKLLNSAFKSYKEQNVEAREDQLKKESKSAANRYGAGSGLDRFKDTMKHLASAPKRLADKVGVDENARKWIAFGAKAGVTVKDLLSAGFAVEKMATINPDTGQPMLVDRYEKWLNPDPQGDKSADELRVLQEQERRAAKVEKFCSFMGISSKTQTDIINLLNVQDTDAYFYTTEAIDIVLNQLISQVVDFAVESKVMDDLRNALKSPHHDSKKLMAAQAAAREIDKSLVAHLNKTIRTGAGDAVAGKYYASLDMQDCPMQ